jgi:hypothetical protein
MDMGSDLQRQNTIELDPLSTAEIYYGQSHKNKAGARVRTYSTVCLFSMSVVGHMLSLPFARESNLHNSPLSQLPFEIVEQVMVNLDSSY